MFNVGGMEFFVILLVALLVIGPSKLPQAARQVGQFMGEFRRIANGFQDELRSAMEDTPFDKKGFNSKPTGRTVPPEKPQSPGGPSEQPTAIEAGSTEVSSAPVPEVEEPREPPPGAADAPSPAAPGTDAPAEP